MPANNRAATVRQLKLQLEEANTRLAAAQTSQEQNTAALEAAQQQIEEQATALAAVRAQAEAAEAAAAQAVLDQQAALNAGAVNAAKPALQLIPKPRVPRGKSLSIQRSMGLEDDKYSEIRYGIHHLVHNASLAWERDFRHQDVDAVARFFHVAGEAFPILKRYAHHWATAAIAGRYMQNIRRYARKRGIIPAKPRYNRGSGAQQTQA
ncbi:hypothetical protein PYCCODRAFT_1477621 [Trametes coccinea BRFM310]|uniref:Uncharacterized protein n=1 Tax=Trametes coccinea (strain BRFM310) TaxID=1353009 RepID=A0A1Y2IPU5_TRAC3|nr:hypothetical protein PYCCODRAFT_1477621 [Trametes coccinea BRFM310]